MPSGLRRAAPARRRRLRATCFGSRGGVRSRGGEGSTGLLCRTGSRGLQKHVARGALRRRRGRRRGPRAVSARGCLSERALLALELRPRRCAAHFPLSGHVILAPEAGLAGPRAAKPQLANDRCPAAAQITWPEPPNCAAPVPRRGPKTESARCPMPRPA